jgi:hypothetical protein
MTSYSRTPVELIATTLRTLGRRLFILRVPAIYDALAIVVVAILGRALLPLRRGAALALTATCFLVYTLIALAAFEIGRLWLPWALPTGLLLVLAALLAALCNGAPQKET